MMCFRSFTVVISLTLGSLFSPNAFAGKAIVLGDSIAVGAHHPTEFYSNLYSIFPSVMDHVKDRTRVYNISSDKFDPLNLLAPGERHGYSILAGLFTLVGIPNVDVVKVAADGTTTQEWVDALPIVHQLVDQKMPGSIDLITASWGSNDFVRGLTPGESITNLLALYTGLRTKYPGAYISFVLVSTQGALYQNIEYQPHIDAINEFIMQFRLTDPKFVPLPGPNAFQLSADGIHPSPSGELELMLIYLDILLNWAAS